MDTIKNQAGQVAMAKKRNVYCSIADRTPPGERLEVVPRLSFETDVLTCRLLAQTVSESGAKSKGRVRRPARNVHRP